MQGLRALVTSVVLVCWGGAAQAQDDLCAGVRSMLGEAVSEFALWRGDPLPGVDGVAILSGAHRPFGEGPCAVAIAGERERITSTSYTCNAGEDSDAAFLRIRDELASCLEITWVEQPAPYNNATFAQFGLLRISLSRNGESGLGLGVEAFRDDQGRVMGSPTRGDGRMECHAKSPEEIAGFAVHYTTEDGAEVSVENGYRVIANAQRRRIALLTTPVVPAHPAVFVRGVAAEGGQTFVFVRGDFAGDCLAFLETLAEIDRMNQGVR
ncbi:MAG: hypothetical protein GC206_10565 [Alphaproteobacteria bacterium]|nr:hypothetical protein [Alphaproteobacteria bacterium]